MGDKITCSSCGAQVDAKLPRCPFCDTLLVEGAEEEYMDKLHDVRKSMEDLNQVPKGAVVNEVKKQGKRIRRIMMITAVIVILLVLLFLWQERQYERDNKADYIWGQQNFPVMSQMYEEGRLEELEEFYYDALMEDKPVWNWEYFEEYSDVLEEAYENLEE